MGPALRDMGGVDRSTEWPDFLAFQHSLVLLLHNVMLSYAVVCCRRGSASLASREEPRCVHNGNGRVCDENVRYRGAQNMLNVAPLTCLIVP